VKILETINEVTEGQCGKVPCYNTIEDWMKKLGLSVYENDRKPGQKKFAMVIDESIMINREKLLLLLGIPADHQGRPVNHEDVTVVSMKVGSSFSGDDVKNAIDDATKDIGQKAEYIISDQGHNLSNGIHKSDTQHHVDISHAMSTILKHAYGNEADFASFVSLLGEIRLQYHLTNKAYLLPPNMRSICRFMNMSTWVDWGNRMLCNYDRLPENLKDAYSFIPENEELLKELQAAVGAVRYVEKVCKAEGFNIGTCNKCQDYVIRNVIGNANSRRAMLGLEMIKYFKNEAKLLSGDYQANHNISSDIIETNFGFFKDKKSPNKLYGITPFVLILPLYPKLESKSAAKTFNFKERLCNVKLKDVDAFAKKTMSTNWVQERIKLLRKVS
jgi:hypothetical protein